MGHSWITTTYKNTPLRCQASTGSVQDQTKCNTLICEAQDLGPGPVPGPRCQVQVRSVIAKRGKDPDSFRGCFQLVPGRLDHLFVKPDNLSLPQESGLNHVTQAEDGLHRVRPKAQIGHPNLMRVLRNQRKWKNNWCDISNAFLSSHHSDPRANIKHMETERK